MAEQLTLWDGDKVDAPTRKPDFWITTFNEKGEKIHIPGYSHVMLETPAKHLTITAEQLQRPRLADIYEKARYSRDFRETL